MSDTSITAVQTTAEIIHISVTRRALSDSAATSLVADVTAAMDANPKLPVILDLKKVEFVPSAVLGALVRLSQAMKLDGRRLYLVHVDRRVRGTLSVTRLDKILELKETLADAIAECKKTA